MSKNPGFYDPQGAYEYSTEFSRHNVRRMIRNRTDKNGLTKVIIEVCQYTYVGTGQYSTRFVRVSTDVWVDPKNWNKKKEIVNGKDPDAETKNKEIDKFYIAVKNYVNSKGQQYPEQVYVEALSLSALQEFFPNRRENRKTLVDYFNDYIQFRRNTGTLQNTMKDFISTRNRLQAFYEYNQKKTFLEDINFSWSDKFYEFLQKKYHPGTIEKCYATLATVLNHYLRRKDELQISLSDKFLQKGFRHGIKSVNEPNPLSKWQLDTLYNHNFDDPILKKTKDRFIFQCFTGLRHCDAFKITRQHIKNNWLIYKPSKTNIYNVRVEQPLNQVALEVLQKYNYDMTKLKISNKQYNLDLKDMFKSLNEAYAKEIKTNEEYQCGIKYQYDINFGSYASRDTFITQCVDNKVDWHDILKFVGQSSFTIMNRYVKTNRQKQIDEVNTVFAKPVKERLKSAQTTAVEDYDEDYDVKYDVSHIDKNSKEYKNVMKQFRTYKKENAFTTCDALSNYLREHPEHYPYLYKCYDGVKSANIFLTLIMTKPK